MANISYQNKVFHVLGLLCFLLLIQKNNAFQYPVGGWKGWTVPDNTCSKSYYNDWANRTRFQIGDSLLFVYDPSQDSVLQVCKWDYENCTTKNPIAAFNKHETVFTFNNSGPHYFISGNKDNCLKNEKLVVVVLADRSSNHYAKTNQTTAAPAPSPSSSNHFAKTNQTTAAPSPSLGYSDMVPAPTPTSVETPPAPAGIADINPTPAPAGVSSNSASSLFVSFVGSMGAFFASSIILSF